MARRIEVLSAIERSGILPIFYHADHEVAVGALRAAASGGASVFEFTNRGAVIGAQHERRKMISDLDLPDIFDAGIGQKVFDLAGGEQQLLIEAGSIADALQRHQVQQGLTAVRLVLA